MKAERNVNEEVLEGRLENVLRPLAPRREFVDTLGHRIESRPPAIVNYLDWRFLLFVLAGVLSMGVTLAVIARKLIALFEVRSESQPQI
ncbi:MAG: hypothetical protein JXB85_17030 [Anaerolineales bacterium]|nr:hypothetical protein [Anaerolineales bacterium]